MGIPAHPLSITLVHDHTNYTEMCFITQAWAPPVLCRAVLMYLRGHERSRNFQQDSDPVSLHISAHSSELRHHTRLSGQHWTTKGDF